MRVYPPVVALLLSGLALGLELWLEPPRFLPLSIWPVGALVVVGGIALGVTALVTFHRSGTSHDPFADPEALVTHGVYARTRNPMYLALGLLLVAWTVFLDNLAAGLGVLVFIIYMNRFQIAPEERVLAEKFGAAYDDYRRKVRRWI